MPTKSVAYLDNEIYCCRWMQGLIDLGLLADGDVLREDIRNATAESLRVYRRLHLFAGIGGWEAALQIAGWPDEWPVWTASCPCFPAGTAILTSDGYKAIEDVRVGDMVLTHMGRFRKVQQIGSDVSECVTVKGQGHWGMTCTPEHPFLIHGGDWCPAKDLAGKRWANVAMVPPVQAPEIGKTYRGYFYEKATRSYRVVGSSRGKELIIGRFKTAGEAADARSSAVKSGLITVRGSQAADLYSIGFAKFLGYWLGDGWTTGDSVLACGSMGDVDLLNRIFSDAGLRGRARLEKTSSRISCGSKPLVRWLEENFGKYAHKKKIPVWIYGMPREWQLSFIDGYFTADGCFSFPPRGGIVRNFATTSTFIAVGLKVLLAQLGFSSSVRRTHNAGTTVIQGRTVKNRDCYRVSCYETTKSFRLEGIHGWGIVKSVEPSGVRRVYNLAVEDDESYTADGIVVHNCQPFSAAGGRKGFADERHLWPEVLRLLIKCKPAVLFGEQVASKDGREWLSRVLTDLEDCGYSATAADLPAAGVSAPHKRQRIFWVAIRVADAPSLRRAWLDRTNEQLRRPDQASDPLLADCQIEGQQGIGQPRGLHAGDRAQQGNRPADSGLVNRRADASLADTDDQHGRRGAEQGSGRDGVAVLHGEAGVQHLADPTSHGRQQWLDDSRGGHEGDHPGQGHRPADSGLGHALGDGLQVGSVVRRKERIQAGAQPWEAFELASSIEGKVRRVKPGIQLLAPGTSGRVVARGTDPCTGEAWENTYSRVGALKGFGNAIVPQVAAIFIQCVMEVINGTSTTQ